jgi:hypothetical protein
MHRALEHFLTTTKHWDIHTFAPVVQSADSTASAVSTCLLRRPRLVLWRTYQCLYKGTAQMWTQPSSINDSISNSSISENTTTNAATMSWSHTTTVHSWTRWVSSPQLRCSRSPHRVYGTRHQMQSSGHARGRCTAHRARRPPHLHRNAGSGSSSSTNNGERGKGTRARSQMQQRRGAWR